MFRKSSTRQRNYNRRENFLKDSRLYNVRMRILIGSNNQHKLTEIRGILPEFEWVTPRELDIDTEIEETGTTFEENALLKARTFAQLSGLVTVADDSGLVVDALNGEPGVYSHRYCPKEGATDKDRREYLVSRLEGKPEPWTARFISTAAIVDPATGFSDIVFGTVEGEILRHDQGTNGFGYDAIFYIPLMGKTLAELSEDEKNSMSHRGASFRALKKVFEAAYDAKDSGR